MDSNDVLALYGQEIPVTYYTSSGFVDTVYRFDAFTSFDMSGGNFYLSGEDASMYSNYLQNCTLLRYTADLSGLVNDANQIVIDLTPIYSIIDTYSITCVIGVSGSSYNPSNPYTSASWDWSFNGFSYHFESPTNTFGFGARATDTQGTWFNFVPVFMSNSSSTSGYSLRAVFPLSSASSQLVIGCPLVSVDASGGTTVTTATTSQQQVDASGVISGISETNDILEEHSGLLGDIIDFLHYIGECIAGDESEVSEVEPIETMENPPDWDDAMSQVESALDDVPDVTASGGFIWALYNMIMSTSPVIKFLVPFGLIITLLSYIWWKK